MKWEYRIETLSLTGNFCSEGEQRLDRLGADRWEAISASPYGAQGMLVILKRIRREQDQPA